MAAIFPSRIGNAFRVLIPLAHAKTAQRGLLRIGVCLPEPLNTMREWLPIPSAASAITLRHAPRNATGLYNCF